MESNWNQNVIGIKIDILLMLKKYQEVFVEIQQLKEDSCNLTYEYLF
jgi:hypothetical protein